ERGSNENQNAIIRRFIPKGSDISKYTNKYIKEIENYINFMPRFLPKGSNSDEIYEQNLCSLMV
ncbi:MAG: IS30 family transposase, partial [Christensenellaceae bacterium]|nr:IS30 family transposase [Christensenellaceae bacterium]